MLCAFLRKNLHRWDYCVTFAADFNQKGKNNEKNNP